MADGPISMLGWPEIMVIDPALAVEVGAVEHEVEAVVGYEVGDKERFEKNQPAEHCELVHLKMTAIGILHHGSDRIGEDWLQAAVRPKECLDRRPHQDRKSTSLNSSHKCDTRQPS